jgi:5-formyltetrahydrofolate cyclo-ligase
MNPVPWERKKKAPQRKLEPLKDTLRKKLLARRNREPEALREEKSNKIKEGLFSLKDFQKAKIILFYLAKGSEVRTHEAIREALARGKRVALPRVEGMELLLGEIKDINKEVQKGHFGILEPSEQCFKEVLPDALDLIILPGIIFDSRGGRVGYGKGYYDRFLKKISHKVPVVGLAYHFQIVDGLPHQEHDIRVCKVITEKRIIVTE